MRILDACEWRVSKDEYPSRVVLRLAAAHEYVTHVEIAPPRRDGTLPARYHIAGEYFSNMLEAEKSFARRVKSHRIGRKVMEV